ncbi:MAG: hypothetical protein ACKOC5_11125 [Chloroflexota bacterium]
MKSLFAFFFALLRRALQLLAAGPELLWLGLLAVLFRQAPRLAPTGTLAWLFLALLLFGPYLLVETALVLGTARRALGGPAVSPREVWTVFRHTALRMAAALLTLLAVSTLLLAIPAFLAGVPGLHPFAVLVFTTLFLVCAALIGAAQAFTIRAILLGGSLSAGVETAPRRAYALLTTSAIHRQSVGLDEGLRLTGSFVGPVLGIAAALGMLRLLPLLLAIGMTAMVAPSALAAGMPAGAGLAGSLAAQPGAVSRSFVSVYQALNAMPLAAGLSLAAELLLTPLESIIYTLAYGCLCSAALETEP